MMSLHNHKVPNTLIQKQPLGVFYEKGVLRNFAKFTEKYLCQSLFFIKACNFIKKETLRPATLLKKRLSHRCFPVNFAKCLWTPFLYNTSWRLLLLIIALTILIKNIRVNKYIRTYINCCAMKIFFAWRPLEIPVGCLVEYSLHLMGK